MLEVVLSNRFKKDLKLAASDQLNDEGQTKAVEYVKALVLTGRYKKCPASVVSVVGTKEA